MSSTRRPWRLLFASLGVLFAVFALFEFTNLDILVQDTLYDFETGKWLVDARDSLGRAAFYNGPKYLIIALATVLLILALGPAGWRTRAAVDRRGLAVGLLTLALVPALVGFSKARTNVFCPSEIRRYGGDVAYVKVLGRFSNEDRPDRRGRCFPAGHSSGGFALIGLMWLRRSRRWRTGIAALSLVVGWWMGGYQMLKGAHYLSHTLVTMVFALCAALAFRCALPERPEFFTGKRPDGT